MKFTCPYCKSEWTVNDTFKGGRIFCDYCKRDFYLQIKGSSFPHYLIYIGLIILCAIFGFFSIVAYQKNNEYIDIQIQYDKLKDEKNVVVAENNQLKEKVSQITKQNNAESRRLNATIESLQRNIKIHEANVETLQRSVRQQESNRSIEEENNKILLDNMRIANNNLNAVNEDLEKENKLLKEQIENHNKKIKAGKGQGEVITVPKNVIRTPFGVNYDSEDEQFEQAQTFFKNKEYTKAKDYLNNVFKNFPEKKSDTKYKELYEQINSKLKENLSIKESYNSNPLTFISNKNTTIKLVSVGSPKDVFLQYKINNSDWNDYVIGDIITLKDKDNLSFRNLQNTFGESNASYDVSNYYKFIISGVGNVRVKGKIQSLVNYDTKTGTYCYLFAGCSKITNVDDLILPYNNLTSFCFKHMFEGCTSITTVPNNFLEATRLAYGCYDGMFENCTSLTNAPLLPAKELTPYCYAGMFINCAFTTAPYLPANTITNITCYARIFDGCRNLRYIEVEFTNWDNVRSDWINGINFKGTFVCPKALSDYSYERFPKGWTIKFK